MRAWFFKFDWLHTQKQVIVVLSGEEASFHPRVLSFFAWKQEGCIWCLNVEAVLSVLSIKCVIFFSTETDGSYKFSSRAKGQGTCFYLTWWLIIKFNCNQHSDFTCQIIYGVEIQLKYSFKILYKYVLFIHHSSQSIIHGKVHTATSWWHHKTTSSWKCRVEQSFKKNYARSFFQDLDVR